MKTTTTITTGAHELCGLTVGQTVTLSTWRNAHIGSGMDQSGTITGRLVALGGIVQCAGCSFAWQEATLETGDRTPGPEDRDFVPVPDNA